MHKVEIIYQDKDVLVLNKPAGLLVHPTQKGEKGTLVDWLLDKYPEITDVSDRRRKRLDPRVKPEDDSLFRPGIVHRLDKDTSGLLIAAKNQKAFDWLKNEFQQRRVVKKYFALVFGQVKPQKGSIVRSISRTKRDFRKKTVGDFSSGKRARTNYQVLRYYSLYLKTRLRKIVDRDLTLGRGRVQALAKDKIFTLLDVQIETGRTHQIRVHLKSIGHPIAGDPLYKFKRQIPLPGLKRQFLHAYYLKLRLPSGKTKIFKSDLVEDLRRVLEIQMTNTRGFFGF